MRRSKLFAFVLSTAIALPLSAHAADNLKLNQHLNFGSDSQDGPLITGDNMDKGIVEGKPNHIIFYGEGWFNSKRQARRFVNLYEKYKDRVNFVVVDVDLKRSKDQQKLVQRFFQGSIPHLTILGKRGEVLYDEAGETSEANISAILDKALR
jgi:hypothetical protein